jgi:penicillin-binding protein 1A
LPRFDDDSGKKRDFYVKLNAFRIVTILVTACATVLFLGAYALMASYLYLQPSLPTVEAMRIGTLPVPLQILTRSGDLIAQIGEKRRVLAHYDDIPALVREAFVAAEDQRFFTHHGFDYSGVMRAALVDLFSLKLSQGASTISMQAARNMFLTSHKDARRKLQEVFLTYEMEHEFTKEEILETYLNVIFLGQRSYGVSAAAATYFGKTLSQLSVAEAATLAGLPKEPSLNNPISNPKAAQIRRRYVLGQMQKLGFIDAATAQSAAEELVSARDHGIQIDVEAPYVAEMARAEVVNRFGEDAVNVGYRVYTTIDGRLQSAANRAVRLGLIEYDRRHGYRGPIKQLSIDDRTPVAKFDSLMAEVPEIGDLHPALVVSVAPQSARVYVRSMGYAQIGWEGLSWARKRLSDTRTGPAPTTASEVIHRGDVIDVVTDGKGAAQLAELPEAQSALVAVDPHDGAVAALVGGFDFYDNKFNRATQARRQPGSGFKPFIYSAALENGFTPASIVMDAPIVYDDSGQEKIWRPENYEHDFKGPMRLREALVLSRNLVTIRVARQLGIDTIIHYTSQFGFNPDDMPHDMTIALGSIPVTPLQMATAYAVFANGGYRVDNYFIDRIEDASGKVVYQSQPKFVCDTCDASDADNTKPSVTAQGANETTTAGGPEPDDQTAPAAAAPAAAPDPDHESANPLPPMAPADRIAPRVISAQNDWIMDDMMHDVITRGTGIRAGVALHRSDISGKTGTTNGPVDTWFNGFNENIVASVWVGFDQERPLGAGEEGSRTAVPIWINFMREALRAQPDQPRAMPPGLVTVRISPTTGALASANEADAINETFMEDRQPQEGQPGNAVPATVPQNPNNSSEPLF